ncbi:MAG TPA: peptidoglycan-binding protein [Candidatus Eisenbacteria bacterium]|nr:peptidoglycan-binding protein [Candidatus Eisenbacteria bacterium]
MFRHLRTAALVIALAVFAAQPAFAAAARHPKTLDDLRAAAAQAQAVPPQRKLRILLVPGHEPNFGGGHYGKLKERDFALELSKDLRRFLEADGRYEVVMSRDDAGWNPAIAKVFAERWSELALWREQVAAEFEALIASGKVTRPVVHVRHNKAPNDVALRLYGVVTWANENDIDLMVHVHFDAVSRWAGHRTGFAVYVPPPQYANGAPSKAVAGEILPRLSAFDPVSDLRVIKRLGGLVDDPQLIAVGKNDSAASASLLIEYAFMHELQLRTPAVRTAALDDMAYRTYLGLGDFFFDGKGVPARPFATSVLPHRWTTPVEGPAEIFALQTALMADGVYPPPGKSANACPRTGTIGPCTRAALRAFQTKYGIVGENGRAGEKTTVKLNALYSR